MIETHLLEFASQIREALSIAARTPLGPFRPKAIHKILFCGMGGSAIGGDILRRLEFQKDRVPFIVHRAPRIPKWVDKHTLAIISSYSGNTREVLEAFRETSRAGAQMILLTAGGKLAELAQSRKIPYVRIPPGIPPRCAVGFLTFALFPVLKKLKLISVSDREIAECIRLIEKPERELARSIAKKIANRYTHIYGVSGVMEPVVVRWRCQLAENAKTLVSHQFLPEMFHNEIEGWAKPRALVKKMVAIFISDRDDPDWIVKKRKIASTLIRASGACVVEVFSQGRSPLARIFSLISLGDWVSFELARIYKVDPFMIGKIDTLKKL